MQPTQELAGQAERPWLANGISRGGEGTEKVAPRPVQFNMKKASNLYYEGLTPKPQTEMVRGVSIIEKRFDDVVWMCFYVSDYGSGARHVSQT
jgi:hypothetical protein